MSPVRTALLAARELWHRSLAEPLLSDEERNQILAAISNLECVVRTDAEARAEKAA